VKNHEEAAGRVGAGIEGLRGTLHAALLITVALLGVVAAASDVAAQDAVVVRNVIVTDGVVSGDLANTSHHLVRDVRLLVRHTWVWANERSPGEDSPGRSAYTTVHEDISPGGSLPFTVRPNPPLPVRSDGRFETSVEVVGVTEIGN
jgi:hypothetical protein